MEQKKVVNILILICAALFVILFLCIVMGHDLAMQRKQIEALEKQLKSIEFIHDK